MAKCFIESPGMGKELINWSLHEESRAVPLDSDWDVDGEEMVRLVVVLLLLVLLFGLGVMMELLEMEEEKLVYVVLLVLLMLLPGVLQDSKLLELVPR